MHVAIDAAARAGINSPRIVDDHVICSVDDGLPRAALEDLLKTVRYAGG